MQVGEGDTDVMQLEYLLTLLVNKKQRKLTTQKRDL